VSFQKTNELNDQLGTFNTGETAYLFTISKGFSPPPCGRTNLKMVRQNVEPRRRGSASTWAAAVGQAFFQLRIASRP